MCCWH